MSQTGSVQHIVVRRDLRMSKGKMAAQVAHASLGAVLPHFCGDNPYIRNFSGFAERTEDLSEWLQGSFTKVVLRVDDRAALESVASALDDLGIPYEMVRDSCLTELTAEDDDGTTPTCLGVCPILRDRVPPVLRELKLWRD